MTMPNAVSWFDLYVDDLDRATKFYEAVFQHTLEPIGDPTGETIMRGFPASMQGYGAAGALVKAPYAHPGAGGTLLYFGVDDCAVEQARVIEVGGTLVRPKFSIGQFGWVALCIDTEGNPFGISSIK